jgi:lipoic acid synthetase
MGECWGAGTATFMILGNVCTRSCRFCAVATGRPDAVDWDEPKRVAEAIQLMGVKHAVITSVDRDDLKDCGSTIWAMTVEAVRSLAPGVTMETLIPDFKGKPELISRVIDVRPEVISHNMETVKRLTRTIRPQSKYERSLEVLSLIKSHGVTTKSGVMLGLGETEPEVLETMRDLLDAGVDVLTIGQYLQPTPQHAEVREFVHPDQFAFYKDAGLRMGFRIVESSPLVRSSYHAEKHIL